MVRLAPRLVGIVLLAGSCGSTLIHRTVYVSARHGPAQAMEGGLALLTFVLASAGVLLLIHGGKLLQRARSTDPMLAPPKSSDLRTRLEAPIIPAGRAFDTRHGASMMQARYLIAMSRRTRSRLILEDVKVRRASQSWTAAPRH